MSDSYTVQTTSLLLQHYCNFMIHITINGETHRFNQPINIAQLIDDQNLRGKRIAIERNGEIVPRSQFTEQFLADGDQLEVVVAVGGG